LILFGTNEVTVGCANVEKENLPDFVGEGAIDPVSDSVVMVGD
jgi:hypothetical protein